MSLFNFGARRARVHFSAPVTQQTPLQALFSSIFCCCRTTYLDRDVRQQFLVDISERFSPEAYNLFHHNVRVCCGPDRLPPALQHSVSAHACLCFCSSPRPLINSPADGGSVKREFEWFITNLTVLKLQCNNFSDELAAFLTGEGIPPHITSLPAEVLATPFGQSIAPMMASRENAMGINTPMQHQVSLFCCAACVQDLSISPNCAQYNALCAHFRQQHKVRYARHE